MADAVEIDPEAMAKSPFTSRPLTRAREHTTRGDALLRPDRFLKSVLAIDLDALAAAG
jgi:hypothetical protein